MFANFTSVLSSKGRFALQRLNPATKYNSIASINNLFNINLLLQNDISKLFHSQISPVSLKDKFVQTISNVEQYENFLAKPILPKDDVSVEQIIELVEQNWSSMNKENMLKNFELLSHYANKNKIAVNDLKYQDILTAVANRCSSFSDEEIHHFINCLSLWNIVKNDPFFETIVKYIDKECLNRMKNWSKSDILLMNDYYLKLYIQRTSDFTWHSLKKLCRKIYKLSPQEFVRFAYLLKLNRNVPVSLFEIQYHTEMLIDKLTLQEIGLIVTILNKYKCVIRSNTLVEKLTQKLQDNIDEVDDKTLGSILQILHFTNKQNINWEEFLKTLELQIPFRELETITHIAKFHGEIIMSNKTLESSIIDKCTNNIKELKLVDIDRLMYMLHKFNYDPQTTPLYSLICDELLNPERQNIIEKMTTVYLKICLALIQLNYYNDDLIKRIMDPEYINKICKNDPYKLQHHLYVIDYHLEIEHTEYNGPRLNNEYKNILIKKYGILNNKLVKTSFKLNKILSDVINTCQQALGLEKFCTVNPFPFTPVWCIMMCYNKETKTFEPVGDILSSIPNKNIKYAPDDGNEWLAILIGNISLMSRKPPYVPTGILSSYERLLKHLGYVPIIIPYSDWYALGDENSKQSYLKHILNR